MPPGVTKVTDTIGSEATEATTKTCSDCQGLQPPTGSGLEPPAGTEGLIRAMNAIDTWA